MGLLPDAKDLEVQGEKLSDHLMQQLDAWSTKFLAQLRQTISDTLDERVIAFPKRSDLK